MQEQASVTPMLVAGQWRTADASMPVHDPATGQVLAQVPKGTRSDVDQAVEASRAALESKEWRTMDPSQRGRILQKLAALTYAKAKDLALTESRNNGKTLKEAMGDVRFAAMTLEYFAGWSDKAEGRTIPVPGDRLDYTLRQPLGVTAHIVPWNFPLQLAVRSIAPALAAGCTVVAKPASLTPLSLLEWARLAEEAGLPRGVLQVVTGPGAEVGGRLAAHPGVDGVSLTGSVATGVEVMKAAADNVTPVTLELGGKGAHLVLPDADLKKAAKGICFGIFMNAGQMCWAGSRLLVHESVHDALVEAVKTEAAAWKIGPGTQDGVRIGSMVSQGQRRSVLGLVQKGTDAGARLVTGGKAPADPALAQGAFVEPTILTGVEPKNVVWREEIFGPVLSVMPFSATDDAVKLANGSDYGLLNGVWTKDLAAAHRVARDLECGMVSVNEYPITFPQTPFTGWKKSGIGAEQGRDAMAFYTRTKNVNIHFG
ncbi:MAG TPA: aldehyde dehydrogenase family protein [Candidatus Thermoplasmatota archaeon]|nr:aldehyde dehydrogenase family protein [Candidatus Thermoplasmatota archaeon]